MPDSSFPARPINNRHSRTQSRVQLVLADGRDQTREMDRPELSCGEYLVRVVSTGRRQLRRARIGINEQTKSSGEQQQSKSKQQAT